MTEKTEKTSATKPSTKTARKTSAKPTATAKKPATRKAATKTKTTSKAKSPEKNVRIDGKDYPLSSLSDQARAQILNLQATDQRIEHLQQELAITQTARKAYSEALAAELGAAKDVTIQ
jgi:hypothetical protein